MYYVEICTLYMYLYNASMQTKLVSYIKLFDSSSLQCCLYQTEEIWNVYVKHTCLECTSPNDGGSRLQNLRVTYLSHRPTFRGGGTRHNDGVMQILVVLTPTTRGTVAWAFTQFDMAVEDTRSVSDKTLFVRNLPYGTSDKELEAVFSEYGPLKSCFTVKEKGVHQ